MSASIAHDLRNPLGAVRNAAYLLKRRLDQQDPRLLESLNIIEHEVVKANRIITNLLNLTRSRSPNKGAVDFAPLVRRILSNTRDVEKVECHISLSAEPFVLQADAGQISQVFANILDNAVQAMDGHGELFISATRDDRRDVLIFKDTGPGWPEAIRDRLFEPLVSTKTTGTGLGLAICRQIVESHNGTIEAIDGERSGAAIRIVLPGPPETSGQIGRTGS
jgi:signal transduction histidine kinase